MDKLSVEGGLPLNVTLGDVRYERDYPFSYRLARRVNGELVLQGCFESWAYGPGGAQGELSQEWRDIPTVDL